MAGDARAWEEIVERCTPVVFSLCCHAGLERADAEDVAQEVMLSALRGLRSYRGCRLTTWFYRIARRRLADHFRSPARRQQPAGLGEAGVLAHAAASGAGPEVGASRAEQTGRARAALERLAEPVRSILLDYYLGELSVREIASERGMPENTVKSHLRRGRHALRAAVVCTRGVSEEMSR